MNPKFFRNGIVMLVLVVGTVALLYTWVTSSNPTTTRPYSGPGSFLEDVESNRVEKVVHQGDTLSVHLKDVGTGPQPDYTVTVANVLVQVQQDIARAVESADVRRTDLRGEAGARHVAGSACS